MGVELLGLLNSFLKMQLLLHLLLHGKNEFATILLHLFPLRFTKLLWLYFASQLTLIFRIILLGLMSWKILLLGLVSILRSLLILHQQIALGNFIDLMDLRRSILWNICFLLGLNLCFGYILKLLFNDLLFTFLVSHCFIGNIPVFALLFEPHCFLSSLHFFIIF